jgi:predicted N-acetyltransferase YhbS
MHKFSPYRDIPYCEHSMHQTMRDMVARGLLIVAFDDGKVIGGIGGSVAPMFINHAHQMAYECFWWVHEEHRGRLGLKLLKAFETRAKELDCSFVMMMTLSLNDVGALYERLGYEKFETGYVKRL